MKKSLLFAILSFATASFSQSREDVIIKDSLSFEYRNHTFRIIRATVVDAENNNAPSQGDFVGKLITVKSDMINYVDLQVEGKRVKRYIPKIEDEFTVMRMENDLETELEIVTPMGITGEFYSDITITFKGSHLSLTCLRNPEDDEIKVDKIISNYYTELHKPKNVKKSIKRK